MHPMHRVAADELPYKKTLGLPLKKLVCLRQPYVYKPRKGAVGIAIYRQDDVVSPQS